MGGGGGGGGGRLTAGVSVNRRTELEDAGAHVGEVDSPRGARDNGYDPKSPNTAVGLNRAPSGVVPTIPSGPGAAHSSPRGYVGYGWNGRNVCARCPRPDLSRRAAAGVWEGTMGVSPVSDRELLAVGVGERGRRRRGAEAGGRDVDAEDVDAGDGDPVLVEAEAGLGPRGSDSGFKSLGG